MMIDVNDSSKEAFKLKKFQHESFAYTNNICVKYENSCETAVRIVRDLCIELHTKLIPIEAFKASQSNYYYYYQIDNSRI